MQQHPFTKEPFWRLLSASVPGTSHLKSGRGCDDAYAYEQQEGGLMLLAVADGAGSAGRSAEGAALAVQTAIQIGKTFLTQQPIPATQEEWVLFLTMLLRTVRSAFDALLLESGIQAAPDKEIPEMPQPSQAYPLREFATTLLVVIVTPQWVASAQIGDGAAVVLDGEDLLRALITPRYGEYINETSFVTDPDYLDQAQFAVWQMNIQGIALFTDGLQLLALDIQTCTPFAPFFLPLFSFVQQEDANEKILQEFLLSERVCARTDDDKTLMLAVKR